MIEPSRCPADEIEVVAEQEIRVAEMRLELALHYFKVLEGENAANPTAIKGQYPLWSVRPVQMLLLCLRHPVSPTRQVLPAMPGVLPYKMVSHASQHKSDPTLRATGRADAGSKYPP